MDLSTNPILLLKFDDLGFYWVWLLPGSCWSATLRLSTFTALRKEWKRGVKAPETEEALPWKEVILSITPTVFTASADVEGLLQCVCVSGRYNRLYLFLWFRCKSDVSELRSHLPFIHLSRRHEGLGGANLGSIRRKKCEEHMWPHSHLTANLYFVWNSLFFVYTPLMW